MNIDYAHKTNPRSQSIKLKIETNGQIVVVTPRGIPKFLIEQFVHKQKDWINKHLTKLDTSGVKLKKDEIQIFGKKFNLQIVHDHDRDYGLKIIGQKIILNSVIASPSQQKITLDLQNFFKRTAEKYLFPRTYQLGKLMQIDFKKITLRQQKSRWGSCSSRGTLSFNWRLVHFSPEVIDYVIIHELAHRIHMNHSAAFWKLVKLYDPKYLTHRRILRRYQANFI